MQRGHTYLSETNFLTSNAQYFRRIPLVTENEELSPTWLQAIPILKDSEFIIHYIQKSCLSEEWDETEKIRPQLPPPQLPISLPRLSSHPATFV